MATTCVYNVFAGAETGLLKGINTAERTWQNLNSVENANRSREITSLCWGDPEKSELCAGLRDNCVVTFDAAGVSATEEGPFFGASGHIKAIGKFEDKFLTGFSDGIVALWSGDGDNEDSVKIATGDNLWTLAQNDAEPNLFATGGKETPLKLWDINSQQSVFTSKNVKNDWLNLCVPVWVTKAQFCKDSRRIVICTGYSQVRLYDPKVCRRPVTDFEVFKSTALSSLSVCPHQEHQVIVGSTKGDMGLVDLRTCKMVHVYRGFSGGVTDVHCHSSAPVVVSASTDRYVRIHNIETKTLEDKFYLKSRLNCLILSEEWPQGETEQEKTLREAGGKKTDAGGSQHDPEADDTIWDSLKDVENPEKTVSKESVRSGLQQKRHVEEDTAEEQSEKKSKQQKKKKKRKI